MAPPSRDGPDAPSPPIPMGGGGGIRASKPRFTTKQGLRDGLSHSLIITIFIYLTYFLSTWLLTFNELNLRQLSMSVLDLYNKAFSSNLKEDWDAYHLASKRQMEANQSLPHIAIDSKQPSLDWEWEGMSDGLELNPYAAHWWGW